MKSILLNSSDKIEVKSRTVGGIDFIATLQHTTVNTAFAAGLPLDWSLVNVFINLKRGGRTYKIYHGPLLPALADSMFNRSSFKQVLNVGTPDQVIVQAHGVSAKAIIKQTGRLLFHDVINLMGDDLLTCEVVPTTAAVISTVDTTVSTIGFEEVDGIGNGASIPTINVETVKASESSYKYDLGNNVVKASLINTDKSGITTANQVISSVTIVSDKVVDQKNMDRLMTERYTQFLSGASDADARHQCFEIFNIDDQKLTPEDVRLNQCGVIITFNSSNVTASKNWVISRAFINDSETLERAKLRALKHRARNRNQYE